MAHVVNPAKPPESKEPVNDTCPLCLKWAINSSYTPK